MIESTPLVSIIIPVYNPGKHLFRCLASIINQTYRNLEIVLVDDGSTDGSSLVCEEYAANDNRIKVIHQANAGVSVARNAGLMQATGDYFYFPDSDDYIELDSIEYLLDLICEHNCDVVNFEHYVTYRDKEIVHSYRDDFYGLYDVEATLNKLAGGVQFCCNKLFSEKLITAKGSFTGIKFNENILRGEDTLFAAMAISRAERIWFDKRPLYHYVQSENSACRGEFRPSQLTAIKLYDAFEPVYGKYPYVWKKFLAYNQLNLISLYFDIWSSRQNLKKEKNTVNEVLHKYYPEVIKFEGLSTKEKTKFKLFNYSPWLFCELHRISLLFRRS